MAKRMNSGSAQKRCSEKQPRQLKKKPMPLLLLILVDLLVLGAALLVFALFHHVLPRQEQAIGIASQRVFTQVQTTPVPVTEAPVQATSVPVTEAPVQATPVPVTEAPVQATPVPVTEASVQVSLVISTEEPALAAAASESASEATVEPTLEPTPEPTAEPTVEPTPEPTATPDPVGYFGSKFADRFTDGEVISTENSYQSANLNVSWTNVRDLGTEIYIADIYMRNIECFQTGFADDTFGRGYGEWLKHMAERKGSIVTVNGDFCGGRNNGIVIRNGILYRDDDNLKRDVCVLYWDGTMETFSPQEFNTEREMARGAYQAWNFGPNLLGENGEALEEFNSSVKPRNPRTAIGYYEPGHYCLVVIDGRSYQSVGMSMKNLSIYMRDLGCKVAYNLDGGESSEMVWGNERISVPYKNGRQSSDAVLIIDQAPEVE